MGLQGVRVTMPDNNIGDLVFRARAASVSHRIERGALSAPGGLVSLAAEIASNTLQDVQADGRRQQALIDTGSGVHVTQVTLANWEGSDDRWGENDGGDWDAMGKDPIRQLQTLDNAFRRIKVDSEGNAITLEVGEYSDSGVFGPLQVAPREPAVSFDRNDRASSFTATLEFVDIVDLTEAGESLLREGG